MVRFAGVAVHGNSAGTGDDPRQPAGHPRRPDKPARTAQDRADHPAADADDAVSDAGHAGQHAGHDEQHSPRHRATGDAATVHLRYTVVLAPGTQACRGCGDKGRSVSGVHRLAESQRYQPGEQERLGHGRALSGAVPDR